MRNLILATFLVACSSQEDLNFITPSLNAIEVRTAGHSIFVEHKDLVELVDSFMLEYRIQMGKEFAPRYKIVVDFGTIPATKTGVCYYTEYAGLYRLIVMSREKFYNRDFRAIRNIFIHEIGHCEYDLNHTDRTKFTPAKMPYWKNISEEERQEHWQYIKQIEKGRK